MRTGTTVTAVRPTDRGYRVHTDDGTWHARTVVVATGAAAVPTRPAVPLPAGTVELTAADYRNPGSVPDGGVLVVGASASGVQIADELARAGRPVTLAVGEHVRMPRIYRGRDILWWMDASGLLDERWDAIPDLLRARRVPSMQLVGGSHTLDLAALRRRGVGLVGRLAGVQGATAQFSGSLTNVCALADLKLGRLLDRIDAWAARAGVDADPPQRFAPTPVPRSGPRPRPFGSAGIASVVWATGFRPDLSFLVDTGVFDRRGRIVHDGGVTAAPGLYVLGLPFLRRRRSTLIGGAAADARDLADHLVGHLTAPLPAGRRASTRRTVMEHHPVAAAVATIIAGRDPRRLAVALTATARLRALLPGGPDRGARARRRRRPVPRLLRRLRHGAARRLGGRGGRRPPPRPLPPARHPGADPLGVHPDRRLPLRRRAPGGHRHVVFRLSGDRGR